MLATRKQKAVVIPANSADEKRDRFIRQKTRSLLDWQIVERMKEEKNKRKEEFAGLTKKIKKHVKKVKRSAAGSSGN